MPIRRTGLCALVASIGLSGFWMSLAHAQQPITLTVGLYNASSYTALRSQLDQFEAAHPNVKVSTVDLPYTKTGLTTDPAKHLDEIAQLASSADVLQIVPDLLTEADSRTGDFLNLKPYADQDSTLNTAEYYPAVWQSWSWDNALWGIPATVDPIVMLYDPAAFDNAGLVYPSGSWSAGELGNAIRALSVKNAQGEITQSAFYSTDSAALYASLIGAPLYDPTINPNPPKFDQSAITQFLSEWSGLHRDKLLNAQNSSDAPMQITAFHDLIRNANPNRKLSATLLPGGRAGVITWGYAVSGGTQYPQQAYDLARYLADSPEVTQAEDSFSARQTQAKAQIAALTPDQQAIVHQALDKAIPVSELRYTEFMDAALTAMDSGASSQDALQTAQSQADSALKIAMQSHNIASVPITVATVAPKPSPAPGKSALKFGLTTGLIERNGQMTLPNQSAWDAVATEFARTDPEVGQITFDLSFSPISNNDDCFYQSARNFSSAGLNYLLPVDPLTETDPTFNPADFVGTVLAQSSYGGKLWMYPLNVQPSVMTYDPKAFAKAGVPLPVNGWTIDQFVDALKQLHAQSGDLVFAMPSSGYDDLPLLILIAAYGGVPIDYRVDPAILSFADPANVDAIRQVLDLAKAGYIQYLKLNDPAKQNPRDFSAPIQTDVLTVDNYRQMNTSTYQITTFPTGTHFSGLAYNIGSVALNAKTASASACYRWIKTLEKHPELFQAMPAKRTLIDDPNLANAQGSDLIALYKRIAQQLDNLNTIPFPAQSNGHTFPQFIVEHWLYQAFDSYIFSGADLKTALSQSQDWAAGFNTCAATVPPYQPGDTQNVYLHRLRDCAVKFDPTIASIFQF